MSSAILIADTASSAVEEYRVYLMERGYSVQVSNSLEDAVALFEKKAFSMFIVGSTLVKNLDSPLLRMIKRNHLDCKFVLLAANFSAEVFITALHGGVFDDCLVNSQDFRLLESVVQGLFQPEQQENLQNN